MRNLSCFFFFLISLSVSAQNLKTGGKLKPEQANMDIRHYTISLDVDPDQKTINGFAEIDLILLKNTNSLLFDLWHGLSISKVWINGQAQNNYTQTEDDLVNISTNAELPAGKIKVKITYGGKPIIAEKAPWQTGFQWEKDAAGNPWIAVTCQGEGAKVLFPCKDHPSDEPNDGAEMIITVPKGLVVAGPGLLQSVTTKKNKSTFYWKTNYTISNYCILFNVGKYNVVSREYTTIEGNKVPMQYYVLEENIDKAEKLLDLYVQSARLLEKYFGEFPWSKEKIGLVETPHLGMEHQTMIAYGNKYRYEKVGDVDFDWLLHHEFGHEWWANKVTNRDWAHVWIQEGITSFSDALFTREYGGEEAYLKRMKNVAFKLTGKIPVVQGDEIESDSAFKGPVYGKGAFFMHSLRYLMGDDLFFPTLKKLATDPQYTYDNTVTTNDIENLFSKAYRKSLKPFFHFFLYTSDKLEIHSRQTSDEKYFVRLLNLDMPVPLDIVTDKGVQRVIVDKNGLEVTSKTSIQIDPDGYYLKKVITE